MLTQGDPLVRNAKAEAVAKPTEKESAAPPAPPRPAQAEHAKVPSGAATPKKQFPTLLASSWRSAFKADLAQVQREFGPLIKFVSTMDDQKKRIELHEGTIVLAAPSGARASKLTVSTVEIMISFARSQQWRSVRLSGVPDRRKQEAVARLCARRGLILANENLCDVIAEELRSIRRAETTVPAEVVEVVESTASPKPRR